MSRLFWLSFIFLVPVGFSLMVLMTCANTMIQMMVPDHLRGRVMATHVWVFMGMAPFGSLLAGSIAAHLGTPITLQIGGLFCLAGAGLFASRLSRLQLMNK
jgi:MFS family permease